MIRIIYGVLFSGCFGLLMIAVGYWAGSDQAVKPTVGSNLLHQYKRAVEAAPMLEPGDRLPKLTINGWINGSPKETEPADGTVLVIDVVGEGCYRYMESLPKLIELRESMKDRGVQFISLYPGSRDSAMSLQTTMSTSWPIGYEALEPIAKLGSLAPSEYLLNERIAANPVFYVVAGSAITICSENPAVSFIAGGEIVYCDNAARTGHSPEILSDMDAIFTRLRHEIESALEVRDQTTEPQE